jgi:hypothetical protein
MLKRDVRSNPFDAMAAAKGSNPDTRPRGYYDKP